MNKIASRDNVPNEPPLSTTTKVAPAPTKNSNYAPAQMTDDSVFTLATHFFTANEVAAHFSVDENTVLRLHGDAFRKGKANAKAKPRMVMKQFFDEVLARESLLGPEIIKVNDKEVVRELDMHAVTRMTELHARLYEGLGKNTEVTVTHKEVSPEDIKFTPLTLVNKDEPWIK
jgi:hypothetical protein